MFSYATDIVKKAENMAADLPLGVVLNQLRILPLSDFGKLLLDLPDEKFPNLSRLLPRMSAEHIQKSWTGSSGITLLRQSVSFTQSVAFHFERIAGRRLNGSKILDFGCGFGRIMRLMYWFSSPDCVYGLDPWNKSIEICQQDGVLGHLAISDYLPLSLPVDEQQFDLIYAFSVFTHTSERATCTALSTIRRYIGSSGVLIVTIRPRELWTALMAAEPRSESMAVDHDSKGFAFLPHSRPPVDGDITYGDTSMSLDWLQTHAIGWKIAGFDRSLIDPYQLMVCMRPN